MTRSSSLPTIGSIHQSTQKRYQERREARKAAVLQADQLMVRTLSNWADLHAAKTPRWNKILSIFRYLHIEHKVVDNKIDINILPYFLTWRVQIQFRLETFELDK